ncbi:MAG: hypothetical protein Q7P63_14635 [Verrucomicrobiota bacterium JB022]|nr:hypothetical protein [Verrucomicrobiota bacterium JB022]
MTAKVGDNWLTTRGDSTPQLRYSLAEVTTSGRIIAINDHGSLMLSDNNGASWRYDRIEVDGVPVRGSFSELYQVPGGSLIAVMRRLEESSEGYFDYYVRTYFVTSNDNGNTWSLDAFPVRSARHQLSGREYHGVDITGLMQGPGGELLAYGTTTGTNNPGFVYWSIGGAIFRRSGAQWVQAHFGYGPVGKIAQAGGRAVAVSHNAVLDSADGAGWNGYIMGEAQVTVEGSLMDLEKRYRLRLIDIEVLEGTYIAQGATFVTVGNSGLIDTNIFDETFLFTADAPFAGSRVWMGSEEPYRGRFTKIGSSIAAVGTGAAYVTETGTSFSLANNEMTAGGRTVAFDSGATAFGVESSERVWKTTNGGGSWSKILDLEPLPDLDFLGASASVLFARGGGCLWASYDQGDSWQEVLASFNGYGEIVRLGDGTLLIAQNGGGNLLVSSDNGRTWSTRAVNVATGFSGYLMRRADSGRILLPATGRDISGNGKFYYSDDDGNTWSETTVGLPWGESPGAAVFAGSGHWIVTSNSFASFNPTLYLSADNGATWTESTYLRSLEGLDTVSGDPSTKVIEIQKLVAGSSGRVVALGDDEILTSDDHGATWKVRFNFDYDNPGPFLAYEIRDIIEVGARWVAIGHYRTPYPQSRNKFFLLISDDDGATWGQRPFETRMPSTFLYHLAATEDGRLIIAGDNGAVFTSDPEPPLAASVPVLTVGEGRTEALMIERPDADGAIEASYVLRQDTARAGIDFVAAGGKLSWAANDFEPKPVTVQALDNQTPDPVRQLHLQLAFETSDAFVGTIETPIAILDDEQRTMAGLLFEDVTDLYTTEAGGSVAIEFVLERKPTTDVTVHVSGLDATEGTLSAQEFTFTPANYNQLQTLIVTGIDDAFPDGDSTYDLTFTVETSDVSYAALSATKISVTNRGEEAYVVDGETLDDIFAQLTESLETSIAADGSLRLHVPASRFELDITSQTSTDMVNWSAGPVPTKGETSGGYTYYTVPVANPSQPTYFRFYFAYPEE